MSQQLIDYSNVDLVIRIHYIDIQPALHAHGFCTVFVRIILINNNTSVTSLSCSSGLVTIIIISVVIIN